MSKLGFEVIQGRGRPKPMTSDEAINLLALYSGVSAVARENWKNIWKMAFDNISRATMEDRRRYEKDADGLVEAAVVLERCGW